MTTYAKGPNRPNMTQIFAKQSAKQQAAQKGKAAEYSPKSGAMAVSKGPGLTVAGAVGKYKTPPKTAYIKGRTMRAAKGGVKNLKKGKK